MKTQIFDQIEKIKRLKSLLKNKKIAVHGLGISGFKTLELLKLIKEHIIFDLEFWAINQDEKKQWKKQDELRNLLDEKYWLSEDDASVNEIIASMDLIILGPGIPREHRILKTALDKNIPIWSEIELAYHFVDSHTCSHSHSYPHSHSHPQIIAVTGSNGKTTTVSIMQDICTNMGMNPFVGGNIGLPFCEYAINNIRNAIADNYANNHADNCNNKSNLIILELSSFQLESIDTFKPNIAILTNLSSTHTERYSTFKSYAQAKFNITNNMNNNNDDFATLIYSYSSSEQEQEQKLLEEWVNKLKIPTIKINSSNISQIKSELQSETKAHLNLKSFKLVGNHNILNLYLAYKSLSILFKHNCTSFNENNEENEKNFLNAVQTTINHYKGVHYRIEKINFSTSNTNSNLKNNLQSYTQFISFYNDAKSTNLDATKRAIEAVYDDKTDLYLIFGGKRRTESAGKIWNDVFKKKVKHIYLIGETTEQIANELNGKISFSRPYTLDNVIVNVKEILSDLFSRISNNYKNTEEQKHLTLLFSPGYPSFDQFENYIKRGEYFEKIVIDNFSRED